MELQDVKNTSQLIIDEKKYYKILNQSLNHYEMHYVPESLNVDIKPFNPSGECKEGGLYFFSGKQLENFSKYINKWSNVYYIAEVLLPEDAKVYHEKGKSKADKILLGPLHKFWSNVDLCLIAISQYGPAIKDVNEKELTQDQYYELCLNSVHYGYALDYINENVLTQDQYYDICVLTITIHTYALKYMKEIKLTQDQYYNLCIISLSQSMDSLCYVNTRKLTEDQYKNLKKKIEKLYKI